MSINDQTDQLESGSNYLPIGSATGWKEPEIYSFPPLFTKQVNEQTWQAQKRHWVNILLSWCKAAKCWILDANAPIFRNNNIDREVRPEVRAELLREFVSTGNGVWTSDAHETVLVHIFKPQQVAAHLQQWASDTGQNGAVLSLYELTSGELAGLEQLDGMHSEVLLKALAIMSKKGQLAMIKEDGKVVGIKLA